MSRRVWIISGSIAVHTGVAVALFAHGVWDIDQLDPGRADVSLAVPMSVPPPPAASGAPNNVQVPVSHPKRIAKDLTQQKPKITLAKAPAVATGGGGDTNGTGPGGPGGGEGTCLIEPCGPPIPSIPVPPDPVPEVKIPPKQTMLTGDKINELRLSGETQIAPDYNTKREMEHANKRFVKATFKVCIDPSGATTPTMLRSTGFAAYDARLVEGIRKWRYRPLTVDGKAVPSCGPVHFEYTMH